MRVAQPIYVVFLPHQPSGMDYFDLKMLIEMSGILAAGAAPATLFDYGGHMLDWTRCEHDHDFGRTRLAATHL
jgi:hypothetical protein